MIFWTRGCGLKKQARIKSIAFACLYLSATLISTSQAKEELYITDDYLQGLSDEVDSTDYIEKAKQELINTEKHEKSQTSSDSDIQKALLSMYNFETLIRTKYPSSHSIYSTLSISARILIYSEFKNTKKLSAAKRMILKKYEKK